jgi:hypothetical protein
VRTRLAELRRARAPGGKPDGHRSVASQTIGASRQSRRGSARFGPHGAERPDRLLPRSHPYPRGRLSADAGHACGRPTRFATFSACAFWDVCRRRRLTSKGKRPRHARQPDHHRRSRSVSSVQLRPPTPTTAPERHDHERRRRGGKSTTAANLAVARPRRTPGHLIDAASAVRVHRLFSLDERPGLTDIQLGDAASWKRCDRSADGRILDGDLWQQQGGPFGGRCYRGRLGGSGPG